MNILNKIAAVAVLSLISSMAFAEATGEASVRAAAEGTVAKIEEAVKLAEQGADKAEIIKLIKEARQLQKDFRYEITERERQKGGNQLKHANEEFAQGDKETGKASLKQALAIYSGMLKTYLSAH